MLAHFLPSMARRPLNCRRARLGLARLRPEVAPQLANSYESQWLPPVCGELPQIGPGSAKSAHARRDRTRHAVPPGTRAGIERGALCPDGPPSGMIQCSAAQRRRNNAGRMPTQITLAKQQKMLRTDRGDGGARRTPKACSSKDGGRPGMFCVRGMRRAERIFLEW